MSRRQAAFTLIELLVVVAIIALLISILLPSLRAAREQAKAVKCGAQLQQMGIALHVYLTENKGFYPGEHSMKNDDGGGGGPRSVVVWAPRIRKYTNLKQELFWCPSEDDRAYWQAVFGIPHSRFYKFLLGYGYQWNEKPLNAADHGDLFCYGYNSWGVAEFVQNERGTSLGLGAHVDDIGNRWVWKIRTEDIVNPSQMIAIADGKADGNWDSAIDPENWQDHEWPSERHFGGAEVLFCDSHVVWMAQSKLVEPTEWTRRMWNNDYLPHKDVWQDEPWGK